MSLAPALLGATSKPGADADWRLRLDEGHALVRLATPIALIALVNMGTLLTATLSLARLLAGR